MKKLLIVILILISNYSFSQVPFFANKHGVGGTAYDADATVLFTKLISPTDKRKASISNLYVRLKDSLGVTHISQVFDKFFILSNYDTVSALINWSDNGTTTCIGYGSPTFSANNGYTFGTGKYLNTQLRTITDGINFTLNSNSFGVYCNTTTASVVSPMGIQSALAQLWVLFISSTFYYDDFTITQSSSGLASTTGLFSISRTASNLFVVYHNADSITNQTTTPSTVDLAVFIGAANQAGAAYVPTGQQIGMSYLAKGLTTAQIRKIYNCYQSWLTDIGAE